MINAGRIGRAVLAAAALLLAPGAIAHAAGETEGLAEAARAHASAAPVAPAAAITALTSPSYPATRRDPLVERLFGEDLADPYRWLEADVRTNPEVGAWVAQQNAASAAYLAQLPGRDTLLKRIRSLFDYERFSLPRKAGKRYFYLRNSGLQNQAVLHVREGLNGPARVLIDPNTWRSATEPAPATTMRTLDAWVPSPAGRLLAYSEQIDGSDWRTIRVADVATGKMLDDRLEWANDTAIGWVGDAGFLYARYPEPPPGAAYQAPVYDKAIWYHRIGTPQSADTLVFATPDHRDWNHRVSVTSDGRWAVIMSSASTLPRRTVRVIPLHHNGPQRWDALAIVPEMASDWKFVEGIGNRLWFLTNQGAPHYRLLRLDLSRKTPATLTWTEVVGEKTDTLDGGRIVGDRLILSYLQRGSSIAVVTDLRGRPQRAITVNAIGSASGFGGRPGDPETFYQFSSFNQPPTIFRLDLRSGEATAFAVPKVPFNPDDYVVEQRSFSSKDGTKVPMYLVRARALAQAGKAAPTLLYGYGGFDISLTPGYSAVRMAWLKSGGVFALANIRGGGEFGPAWYEAGRLAKKQNSFDDFIAAGEYLLREGIAARGGLAIQGGSNGGMMVGAVINQRPDLFAAANPDVGVMDMLRFDRFTQGRFWTEDYGSPAREADWRVLRAYSPYHNIRAAADYPAILVTTADTDDRVVPAHSFKYIAALQAAALGTRPHLLRVEAQSGHGPGKPVDKVIASGADVLAFLAKWTGLAIAPERADEAQEFANSWATPLQARTLATIRRVDR